VRGSNLATPLSGTASTVAVHNRSGRRTDDLVAQHGDDGHFASAASPEEFARRPVRASQVKQALS
jgi:6-phosphogluconate dehydrogenase